MKKIFLILLPTIIFSQVGINTATPTQTLDVNGTVRVRDLPTGSKDNYLVVSNENGDFFRLPISEIISQSQNQCPVLDRDKSTGYYLLFKSSRSIPNPNNSLLIDNKNFVSAGTWIENNTYHYSYSNTSGVPLNISSFGVLFSSFYCNY